MHTPIPTHYPIPKRFAGKVEEINQGGCVCYLRDPDGFKLELMQPPTWRFEEVEKNAKTL
jgi:hypothetical protein